MSPSPRLSVWCWAPACRGISQGFCFCLAEAVLLCFVCSQSVSFVSVFEKTIRSLPPPPPAPLSAWRDHGHCILERSGRSGKQPEWDLLESSGSPRCCLSKSISAVGR